MRDDWWWLMMIDHYFKLITFNVQDCYFLLNISECNYHAYLHLRSFRDVLNIKSNSHYLYSLCYNQNCHEELCKPRVWPPNKQLLEEPPPPALKGRVGPGSNGVPSCWWPAGKRRRRRRGKEKRGKNTHRSYVQSEQSKPELSGSEWPEVSRSVHSYWVGFNCIVSGHLHA